MTLSTSQTEEIELSSEPVLSLQNATISYGSNEAVKNVFCDIPKGKVTSCLTGLISTDPMLIP